jgi:type IX secretion system PorP/SprF family membrane protein
MQKMKKISYKMKKIHLIFVFTVLMAHVGFAQQDPMFTQYNYNMQTVNPAYAGSWERLGFLVLGRYQWVGMDGAPTTYTFSMQSPTRNDNVSWGLNVISDKIGKEKRLTLAGDYSYRVQFSDKTFMRLGIKGGITNYSNPLSTYDQYSGNDEAASEDVEAKYLPNFGVGAFLYSEKYYVGFSIPKLIENDLSDNYQNFSTYSEMRHFFLSAGYVFTLNENLKFKPTGLLKAVVGSPLQVDVTGNVIIKDKVWLGAMYRFGDSFGFLAQFVANDRIRIGYSVDFTTTEMQYSSNGTHELMISYELGVNKKWSTPRAF